MTVPVPPDSRDFRHALGCFATGIAVATTLEQDGTPAGVTVNSFSSVSLDPPLVQFCLGRAAMTFGIFTAAPSFAINILSAEQTDLSVRFSKRDLQERWGGIATERWDTGVPILAGCLASLECGREHLFDAGDHVIIVGRVRRLAFRGDGQPLLYFRGAYAGLS